MIADSMQIKAANCQLLPISMPYLLTSLATSQVTNNSGGKHGQYNTVQSFSGSVYFHFAGISVGTEVFFTSHIERESIVVQKQR